MALVFKQLFKIDRSIGHVETEQFENEANISTYVEQVIADNRKKYEREYRFRNGEETARNNVKKLASCEDIDNACLTMASRLYEKEKKANDLIKRMGREIPASMLIIALDEVSEEEYQLFFIKADYDEYLKSGTGNRETGLPAKRKIFKSCVFFISKDEDAFTIGKIMSHDENSGSGDAVYWYHDFLDLEEMTTDEKNSQKAYNAVKRDVLEPIKKKHRQDYMTLRNLVIGYFRSEGVFDIDILKDQIIGSYKPFDGTLDMNILKDKIDKLPTKYKFDKKFTKKPEMVKDRFKDIIPLTPDIELKLKQDIQGIQNVIRGGKDEEGREYILIYSKDGYQFAQGIHPKN